MQNECPPLVSHGFTFGELPSPDIADTELLAWLAEDAPYGDLTTRGLGLAKAPAVARFTARGDMVVVGVEEAARLFVLCGCRCELVCASGHQAVQGESLLRAEGPAGGLLLAWKLAQTLIENASGIASATAAIVSLLREHDQHQALACTRKTFPGTRRLAAKAVRAGGGVMHRLGLSESLLVFPEHRALLPSEVLVDALASLRAAQPEKRLVVEVASADDALAMAEAGAEVLQLERFTPQALADLRGLLAQRGLRPLLAPAGAVNLSNALDYARAGADFLVSSAPYHAPPRDVKVQIASGW